MCLDVTSAHSYITARPDNEIPVFGPVPMWGVLSRIRATTRRHAPRGARQRNNCFWSSADLGCSLPHKGHHAKTCSTMRSARAKRDAHAVHGMRESLNFRNGAVPMWGALSRIRATTRRHAPRGARQRNNCFWSIAVTKVYGILQCASMLQAHTHT